MKAKEERPPKRIFLQFFQEREDLEGRDVVTWCKTRVHDDDVEYVLLPKAAEKEIERFEKIIVSNDLYHALRSLEKHVLGDKAKDLLKKAAAFARGL